MGSFTKIVTVCVLLCVLVAGVFGITCYTTETDQQSGCNYCLWGNEAASVNGHGVSQSYYACLTQLQYNGITIPPEDVNKCIQQKADDGITTEKLYVCDTDLCNERCDGTRVGFGIVVVIATVITAVLQH
uniref:Protein quiver n=1 Tax=Panagrellus redivivus TaxID=6233 RepID=A0A7E4W2V2_PANRE